MRDIPSPIEFLKFNGSGTPLSENKLHNPVTVFSVVDLSPIVHVQADRAVNIHLPFLSTGSPHCQDHGSFPARTQFASLVVVCAQPLMIYVQLLHYFF